MKCKLIYFNFRLAVEWLAILFFAISGVICLSAYFDSQNLQENERIILLISGIVHLVLFVLAFLSFSYTMKILGPYLSEDCKSSISNVSKTFIKIEKVNKHNEVVPRCVNFKMPCPDWGISGYFDKLVTLLLLFIAFVCF